MKTWNDLLEYLGETRLEQRSCWRKGVYDIAVIIVDATASCNDYYGHELPATWGEAEEILLNGARDWTRYVEGGGALVYNGEIAYTLLTPSELKRWEHNPCFVPGRVKEGMTMLDLEILAARQAAREIRDAYFFLAHSLD